MQGASRTAAASARTTLGEVMSGGADRVALAEGLFAATAALDSSAALRRALTDPSRDEDARRGLARRLFGGKVSDGATAVLTAMAASRWSRERDLPDTAENLAVEAVSAAAEDEDRLDTMEDDLFRFGRIVAGSPDLRDALSARSRTADDRAALAATLVDGKVTPEAARLVAQLVRAPRGRRFERGVDAYIKIAAARRQQLTAVATVAVPLDDAQRERLSAALSVLYDRHVQVSTVVDPSVIGGIRVQVGDEVIDGTILFRLQHARRAMTG